MTSLEKERGLERGLVQTIFRPCAIVLAKYLEGVSPLRAVLDVGCGSGIAGRTIAARYSSVERVMGVDFESAALQVAAEQTARDPRFHFQRTDVRTLHVDEPFDAVVAQHLLHQLDEGLVDAVRCMRTALRPRGRLILAQWPNLERCPAYAFIYRASGEYAEQAAKPVMTKERLTELVEQAAGLRIVKTELRTDFETPPRMPHDLLKQYVEGSLGWLRRDSETRRALQESPGLDKLADAYGRRGPDGFTFGLGMLVVVAERTDDRRAAQNVADGLQAHDINTARYSIAVPDNRRVDSLSCAPGPPTALVGERR